MVRSILSASVLALAATSPALAQSDAKRIAALEKQLSAQEAVLRELRTELDQLRKAPAPPTPERIKAGLPTDCTLASDEARKAVLANPAAFEVKCFTGVARGATAQGDQGSVAEGDSSLVLADAKSLPSPPDITAAALYDQVAAPLPGHLLSPAGLVPQIVFGKDSEASLKLSFPVILRNCYYRSDATRQDDPGCTAGTYTGHSPRTLTPYLGVATALDGKLGKVFTTIGGVGDLDISSKTSVIAGLEFVQYEQITADNARKALDNFVDKELAQACEKAKTRKCIPDEALLWALTTYKDGKLEHQALLAKLSALLWLPHEPKPKPLFGFGGSLKLGTQAYRFYPDAGSVGPDPNYVGRQAFTLDRTRALGKKDEDEHQNLKVEGHVFGFIDRWIAKGTDTSARGYSPGTMVLAQVSYLRDWSIPTAAKDVQICENAAANQLLKCGTYNFLAPRRFTTWTVAGEIRTEFLNLRGIGALGFAPRFEYAFDGGRKIFDLPFYVGGSSGSGGIKLTRAYDGTDVLGQPVEDSTTISIFFSPLTFAWP